jgi:hypothetical protein
MGRVVWALFASSVGVACVSRVAGTRTQFAMDMACPEDRVTVAPRSFVPPTRTAPADVAADPERLAMWQENDAARVAAENQRTFFIAQGCGQAQIYLCYYCVHTVGRTTCGAAPNCVAEPACHDVPGRDGYIACGGS